MESERSAFNHAKNLRVLFIHGGGSGKGRDLSRQAFAKYLQKRYSHVHVEHMLDTTNFEACIDQQAQAIQRFHPHVIVTKSQGGPIIMELMQRGYWLGPSVLCCAALIPNWDDFTLPPGVPFILLNGSKDVAVPLQVAHHLIEVNKNLEQNIKLVVVEDGHALKTVLHDETARPNLYSLVCQVWDMRLKVPGFDSCKIVPPHPSKERVDAIIQKKKESQAYRANLLLQSEKQKRQGQILTPHPVPIKNQTIFGKLKQYAWILIIIIAVLLGFCYMYGDINLLKSL